MIVLLIENYAFLLLLIDVFSHLMIENSSK